VVTDAATLRALVFAKRDLAKAERSGEVEIEGDVALVAEVVELFPRPVPATVE
jgi:ubiquinone biosynthesis protein UbiJ